MVLLLIMCVSIISLISNSGGIQVAFPGNSPKPRLPPKFFSRFLKTISLTSDMALPCASQSAFSPRRSRCRSSNFYSTIGSRSSSLVNLALSVSMTFAILSRMSVGFLPNVSFKVSSVISPDHEEFACALHLVTKYSPQVHVMIWYIIPRNVDSSVSFLAGNLGTVVLSHSDVSSAIYQYTTWSKAYFSEYKLCMPSLAYQSDDKILDWISCFHELEFPLEMILVICQSNVLLMKQLFFSLLGLYLGFLEYFSPLFSSS